MLVFLTPTLFFLSIQSAWYDQLRVDAEGGNFGPALDWEADRLRTVHQRILKSPPRRISCLRVPLLNRVASVAYEF